MGTFEKSNKTRIGVLYPQDKPEKKHKGNPKRNHERYLDPTAQRALDNIEGEKRVKEFLRKVFALADKYNLHIDDRIYITDKLTGRRYK